MLRTLFALATLANFPLLVRAQGTPGTNLAVEARVSRIAMRSDTVRIEYATTNAASSQEDLWRFAVEAPSEVIRIERPAPSGQWLTSTTYKTLSVATWGMLGAHLSPGATTPPLAFEALGLPGLVYYWATGWFPVPQYDPETEDPLPLPMAPRDAIAATAVQGRTVGVAPFPADRSPPALLQRLNQLLNDACGSLTWITSAAVCGSLSGKLQQASQAVTQGNNGGARAQLESFVADLTAQHDAGGTLPVKDNAFWLLKVNAEYILSLLPGQASTAFFLAGSGGTANPPTLSLSANAPTATTGKYKDSPVIAFSGGNPWVQVGTWTAAPALASGTLSALGSALVWLGLKNSDDFGTNYDVRTDVYRNGTLVASGQALCIQGITRNPDLAKQVTASFGAPSPASFNGTTDVLSLKVSTRIGTTASGASCGGHINAVGLRLYFDAVNRAAKFDATF